MKRSLPVAVALAIAAALAAQGPPTLPPVPFPPQNPITAPKAVLGKILYWDEQLSSSDTVACGSCHIPRAGGAAAVFATHPGLDGVAPSPDDIRGSSGVVHMDANGHYTSQAPFGLSVQVTGRAAQSAITSQYSPLQFWDGRAGAALVDPLTNQTVIQGGASLEVQSLGPILNSVEMAHEGRTWAEVTAKLAASRPLALATNLPGDVATALAGNPSYGDLFQRAFGDAAITPVRIAMAIATYERTLVANQTPWDAFAAGNPGALTPQQQQGMMIFGQSGCAACHRPPFFTDHSFRNIGIRPVQEDSGRQAITNQPGDAGRFKVPSLRNVGLKTNFMHQGRFTTLQQVIDYYGGVGQRFGPNLDPAFLAVRLPQQQRAALDDFVRNALTDPRVTQGLPPFDRPTLRSERPGAIRLGQASAGSGGQVPALIDVQPAYPGALEFRIGLRNALGGAAAMLAVSPLQGSYPLPVPIGVDLGAAILEFASTSGSGAGNGVATWIWGLPNLSSLNGLPIFAQGFVLDPGSNTMGIAATRVSRLVVGG